MFGRTRWHKARHKPLFQQCVQNLKHILWRKIRYDKYRTDVSFPKCSSEPANRLKEEKMAPGQVLAFPLENTRQAEKDNILGGQVVTGAGYRLLLAKCFSGTEQKHFGEEIGPNAALALKGSYPRSYKW